MPGDNILRRFQQKLKDRKLTDLSNATRSADDLESEQEMLANTKKVDPIKADKAPGRNDPCPCGSGKKYKKCCGAEKP